MKIWVILAATLGHWVAGQAGQTGQTEFLAGTFLLTQKSLNEAPYRYAGVLRQILDKVEQKDPPAKYDEENCETKYRILPSGQRSELKIIDDTLSFTLEDNNTLIIGAKLFARVAAKTWIWKGIDFGLLGCLKMTSCGGDVVTYRANIDMRLSIQVLWDEESEKMAIKIKPVETDIYDVNVDGCKPPWFLFWFKGYQKLLNEGVQEGFQEFANNYEKQKEVPEVFSPFKDVFVHYRITNMTWTPDHVMFSAKASFAAQQHGKNVTFVPSDTDYDIPMDHWNMTSRDDRKSHLLQGIRLSTEFINSLMWFATIRKLTEYRGSAAVLDTTINGTISYDPPKISVQEDNLLSVNINRGLILAECFPKNGSDPAILFKAEFTNLAGSGMVKLASTLDQTGIRASLDQLDLSRMNTKPFEPKLPLPEAFESQLMKSAIAQLQPIVNKYLTEKPLFLPDHVAPLAASPVLHLWSIGNGTGYAELLSYCTCDEETNTPFALCDKRSGICDGKRKKKLKDKRPKKDDTSSFKILLQESFDSIKNLTKKVFSNDNQQKVYNFTHFAQSQKQGNLSYVGFHVTLYEHDKRCRLEKMGSRAKVLWLWKTSRCTPLFLHGQMTEEYYLLSDSELKLNCEDPNCENCRFDMSHFDQKSQDCWPLDSSSSLQVGRPLIYSWQRSSDQLVNYVANVFFSETYCAFYSRYIQPQVLSTHINLGMGNGSCANSIDFRVGNETWIQKAFWDCETESCYGCFYRLVNVGLETCHNHKDTMQVIFTKTIPELKLEIQPLLNDQNQSTYMAIGLSAILVTLVLILTLIVVRFKSKIKEKLDFKLDLDFKGRFDNGQKKCRKILSKHFGLRISSWNELKKVKEDVIQNVMLIANGILAIIFAVNWNSDNNPLLIIHNKFQSVNVEIEFFNTEHVTNFAASLNFYTCCVNVINAVIAFTIVILWIFTKTGTKAGWMKARLVSCALLLASIFVVLAALIFSTYFDRLVILETEKGSFLTDNDSMHNFASQVLKVSLNGLSLTVVSFTIVFLFHGVGGGLYCGTVLFRLSHFASKTQNMEVLTTLLVILTIIQPFICLHPVIIWAQDSQQNSNFLLLIIMIWFLPLGIHIVMKAIMNQGIEKCSRKNGKEETEAGSVSLPAKNKKVIQPKVDTGRKRRIQVEEVNIPQKSPKDKWLLKLLDLGVPITQLVFFLASFSLITHYIIHSEFEKSNPVQNFIFPAITSVFVWMMSIAYLLLSLVLDESRKSSRLVFKDQDLEAARDRLRMSLRRRLKDMDRRSFKARSLQRECMLEAANKKGFTLPARPYEDLSASMRSTKSNFDENQVGLMEINEEIEEEEETEKEMEVEIKDSSFWGRLKRIFHFLLETKEYKDPETFGWRIKFRRIFLTLGTIAFSYQTIQTVISTQNYSSKREIQNILDYLGTNLTWPDSGSVLDDVFQLYNKMERTKSYLMMIATFIFWMGLILDFISHFTAKNRRRTLLFSGSRIMNFFGSLTVFASVIIVSLPDYLEASNLEEICPFCGYEFNKTVTTVAKFSIGLFFACLFTFQLIPILVTIGPALVRASVLILIHPALQVQETEVTNLRMTILQQVIQFSSMLTFPVTFISMAILQQYQKDFYVTLIIVTIWLFPPFLIYLGLHYARKYRRYTILQGVYYLYNFTYVGLLLSLVVYSMTFQRILEVLEKLLQEPTFWIGSIAQIFLCNVVISDMLYMTVFQ